MREHRWWSGRCGGRCGGAGGGRNIPDDRGIFVEKVMCRWGDRSISSLVGSAGAPSMHLFALDRDSFKILYVRSMRNAFSSVVWAYSTSWPVSDIANRAPNLRNIFRQRVLNGAMHYREFKCHCVMTASLLKPGELDHILNATTVWVSWMQALIEGWRKSGPVRSGSPFNLTLGETGRGGYGTRGGRRPRPLSTSHRHRTPRRE